MSRVLSWFSCGAPSAVATKLAISIYGDRVVPVYCNTTVNEHLDNRRFFNDIQQWLGRPIRIISSTIYRSIEEVFDKKSYMSGPRGAPCTVELKKQPRFQFQQPDDIHVFGYTSEEGRRIARFERNNPELQLAWVLRDHGITRDACLAIIRMAGIELPAMYRLGYKNNNCIGCVKASSPHYWNMIRRDAPDVFKLRARQSRELKCKLTRMKTQTGWQRIYLDQLSPDAHEDIKEDLSCGPECAS